MLSNLGILFTIGTLFTSLFIIFFTFKEFKVVNNLIPSKIYKFTLFQLFFSISSFFVLLLAYILSDFSLVNVYENSHSNKPLFYKISGTWGNHEGSLLLWIKFFISITFIREYFSFIFFSVFIFN